MSDTITRLKIGAKEVVLIGTAHVSAESVDQVEQTIREKLPDTVCVEVDRSRYRSMVEGQNWSSLNVYQVLKERKGVV